MTNHPNRGKTHTYIFGECVRLRFASRWTAPAIQHWNGSAGYWDDGLGVYATRSMTPSDEDALRAWQRHYNEYWASAH